MRKIILYILIAITAFACNKKKSVIVSGEITNPHEETVFIRMNYSDEIDTVAINTNDGTFIAEITMEEEHLGWFGHGEFAIPLYFVPGANINLEINAEDIKDTKPSNIKITGKKSETSMFIYSLHVKSNKYSEQELLKMPVDSFALVMQDAEILSQS